MFEELLHAQRIAITSAATQVDSTAAQLTAAEEAHAAAVAVHDEVRDDLRPGVGRSWHRGRRGRPPANQERPRSTQLAPGPLGCAGGRVPSRAPRS